MMNDEHKSKFVFSISMAEPSPIQIIDDTKPAQYKYVTGLSIPALSVPWTSEEKKTNCEKSSKNQVARHVQSD